MIQFLLPHQIDKEKWDSCIEHAHNSFIYGYSWYLDIASPGWSAIVQNDYRAVFPLPTVKKIFTMAYQPFFTQQLGLFYRDIETAPPILEFLEKIPSNYKHVNICLNEYNQGNVGANYHSHSRTNHILHLHQPYQELARLYNSQTKRNILRAQKSKLIITDAQPNAVVKYYETQKGSETDVLKPVHYATLNRLLEEVNRRGFLKCFSVQNAQGDTLAMAAFYFYKNRIVYQLGASSDEGREAQAMTFLFDWLIKTNCNKDLIFDFEGSDISGIARFFSGFGALGAKYSRIIRNDLPWPFSIIKK